MSNTLEHYFQPFRENIIGIDQTFMSPYGEQKLIYTDWIASGRLYKPIEEKLMHQFGPFVANTHGNIHFRSSNDLGISRS